MDGSTLGNLGPSGGGGICRDPAGSFLFAFSHAYGTGTNNRAELRALYDVMVLSANFGYDQILLESDLKCVADIFNGRSSPTWRWRYWWTRISSLKSRCTFSFSLIPREGNGPADGLAKAGAMSQIDTVYDNVNALPNYIRGLYRVPVLLGCI
ncbi:uncharacterized protein LOC131233718 [Magnolia sinica]|uniref:uncharacterized protein LOC131233718 n=1 Tax=Magnolia sinica TaxID=86752 RepID=UPI0026587567|nr:uncharacterized protein LOC131233718 [Magnolia sinica]